MNSPTVDATNLGAFLLAASMLRLERCVVKRPSALLGRNAWHLLSLFSLLNPWQDFLTGYLTLIQTTQERASIMMRRKQQVHASAPLVLGVKHSEGLVVALCGVTTEPRRHKAINQTHRCSTSLQDHSSTSGFVLTIIHKPHRPPSCNSNFIRQ